MSVIQRENRVAVSKAGPWGEAVQPAIDSGVYVKSHQPPKGGRKVVTNEDEYGRGMASSGEVLELEDQTGSMSMRVYAEGLEPIIASLMGRYGSDTAGSVVTHTFILDTVIQSINHTIAWDEGDELKCCRTAKFKDGKFSYADGLNVDLNYQADKVSLSSWGGTLGDMGVNSPSSGKCMFKLLNCDVRINDEGDSDFQDTFNPSGIDINITRGYTSLPVTAGNDMSEEPIEKEAPSVEITLTFPKKESKTAAFVSHFSSRQYKKMRILFTGDIIGAGPDTYDLRFNFPKLFISETPDIGNETPLPVTIKFKALIASSVPAGMEHNVPYIVMKNELPALTGYPS